MLFFSIAQERDGTYSCVCPVGFTGDNCSAPLSSDQNEKESVGMPAAAIAGVVAGILLALVCVALVVVLLCLQWKKAAYFRGRLHAWLEDGSRNVCMW